VFELNGIEPKNTMTGNYLCVAVFVLSAIKCDSIDELPYSHLGLWWQLRASSNKSTGNRLFFISHARFAKHGEEALAIGNISGNNHSSHISRVSYLTARGGGTDNNFAGNNHIGDDDTSPVNDRKLVETVNHGYSGDDGTCTTVHQ